MLFLRLEEEEDEDELACRSSLSNLTPPHTIATSAVILSVEAQFLTLLNALQETVFLLEISFQEWNIIGP
jgi:hypothetical protein